ncbi:hypothetical protein RND81_13G153100 [Saponaria officinalis]|uniref:Glycolipid transfer protein domain-containing protein n=1 Tax=Saponaria officinalis TaxID=3572 RepID=A0AAW1GY69_SAPOF
MTVLYMLTRRVTTGTKVLRTITLQLQRLTSFCTYRRGDSLKEAASTTYSQVFAPYHGWAIRKVVVAGMYALPTKPQLLRKLNEDENSAKIYMQSYMTSVDAVVAHVDKLFLFKDLGIDCT